MYVDLVRELEVADHHGDDDGRVLPIDAALDVDAVTLRQRMTWHFFDCQSGNIIKLTISLLFNYCVFLNHKTVLWILFTQCQRQDFINKEGNLINNYKVLRILWACRKWRPLICEYNKHTYFQCIIILFYSISQLIIY